MECENSQAHTFDYKEIICPIQCDALIQKNQSLPKEYLDFCSTLLVLPILDSNTKQLHLSGSTLSTIEAEKRFLELQTKLIMESNKNSKARQVHWWYEAWDATWQSYNPKITNEIESHYNSKIFNFIIHNQLDENVLIDLNKSEETYGHRIKRIRRSERDENQPIHWTWTPLILERFVLDMTSKEYISIRDNFDNTMKGRYENLISIERVQNVRLFKQFNLLHDEFIVKYNKENNGTMRLLYHGCPESAAKRIIDRGFNRSYCGAHGCVYGRGVYFSSNASYSDRYATANDFKEKRMFFSRVLIGRSMIGRSNMCVPDDGYDTTTDGNHIFVCYQDSQCYPEYMITYI